MLNFLNLVRNPAISNLKGQTFRFLSKTSLIHEIKRPLVQRIFETVRYSPAGKKSSANLCTKAYDINTNVAKDVILFKYENPRFYKILNIFGLTQFIFWTYLSHFSLTTLRDAPVEEEPGEDLAWYRRINLGENKYRNGISIMCFLIGYGIMLAAVMFTLRSVRFLILRPGGKEVSFVTYGPFNKNRIMTVPLKYISAEQSREMAKTQLPIKVKNKTLFYVLDMRGEFRNPKLFDYTAGLKRRI